VLNVIVLACGTGVGLSPETLRLLDVMNRSPEARVLVVGIHRPRPDFANLRIDMSRYIHELRYVRKLPKQKAETSPVPRCLDQNRIRGQRGRVSFVRANGGRYSR